MHTLYDQAFNITFKHEGGFVFDPDDPGGATNYGVSLRWLSKAGELDLDQDGWPDGDIDHDGDIDIDDIRLLSKEDAKELFFYHWWEQFDLHLMPALTAVKTFDLSINMGPRPAFKCLQRAAKACRYDIADDGIIGPQTRSVIHSLGRSNEQALLAALCSEAAGFYRSLIAGKPVFVKYRNGWLNRAYYRPDPHIHFIGE
ncbi:glycoside hydrolase family 108 protein [Kiloniella litopenaei]|uniref:glycoside hydrolase family 108 protein n=1 Tax=Kiloniella litopenaei TaxID=1549748 RepID=UPI003BAAC06B